jgi:hypothetical protein
MRDCEFAEKNVAANNDVRKTPDATEDHGDSDNRGGAHKVATRNTHLRRRLLIHLDRTIGAEAANRRRAMPRQPESCGESGTTAAILPVPVMSPRSTPANDASGAEPQRQARILAASVGDGDAALSFPRRGFSALSELWARLVAAAGSDSWATAIRAGGARRVLGSSSLPAAICFRRIHSSPRTSHVLRADPFTDGARNGRTHDIIPYSCRQC